MDEDTPHIHSIITPLLDDGKGVEKLSYKAMIGGKQGLFQLQTDYAETIEYLGYKRGEIASPHIANISTKQYKAGMNKAVNMELPKTPEEKDKEIRSLRAENYELKVKMEETMEIRANNPKPRD